MGKWLLFALSAAALLAADDPWTKVKELKSGTEIRILKKGATKPIEGKLDEAQDDKLVVVLKNEQVAIPKEDIDRLDYRPKPGSRITRNGGAKDTPPDTTPPVGMDHGANVPGKSYNSGLSIGSKPDYETLYRRPAGAPAKK
jgi:hypothetical protein